MFPHYPATPGAVSGVAADILAGGESVHDVATTVSSHHDVGLSGVEGLLEAPLSFAVLPVQASSADIAQCTTIAGGAMTMWSKAIQTYDDGVDKLNLEYETAKAAGFSVDAEQFYNHGAGITPEQRSDNYHRAVHAADAALQLRLQEEERKLKRLLDAEASTVQGVLQKGPSSESALILAAHGALPAQAAMTFPDVLNDFKTVFDPSDGSYTLANLALLTKRGFSAELALERASLALLQGRHLADAEADAALRIFGNATDMRVLRQYFTSEQSLNALVQAAVDAGQTRAGFSILDAATATGKFSKLFAGLGTAGSLYDLVANPDDHTGLRRHTDQAMDVVGTVGGVGALALGSETLAATALLANPVTGPVVVGCLAVAGAYAVGTLVYDHWDDITDGVSTAVDWTGDQLDAAADKVDDAADWAEDQAEKIPVIGGLF